MDNRDGRVGLARMKMSEVDLDSLVAMPVAGQFWEANFASSVYLRLGF